MKSAKIISWIGVLLAIVLVAGAAKNFITGSFDRTNIEENNNVVNTGEVQRVDLGIKNYNYYPNTINLKYNVPAEIVVDTKQVKGCFTSLVIPDFKVRKYVTPGDNVIKFLPNKKGEFSFSCSMGMGYGKIIVN